MVAARPVCRDIGARGSAVPVSGLPLLAQLFRLERRNLALRSMTGALQTVLTCQSKDTARPTGEAPGSGDRLLPQREYNTKPAMTSIAVTARSCASASEAAFLAAPFIQFSLDFGARKTRYAKPLPSPRRASSLAMKPV
jgi:hypothetical protein